MLCHNQAFPDTFSTNPATLVAASLHSTRETDSLVQTKDVQRCQLTADTQLGTGDIVYTAEQLC